MKSVTADGGVAPDGFCCGPALDAERSDGPVPSRGNDGSANADLSSDHLPVPGAVLDLSSFHLTLPTLDPMTGWAAQINQPALNTFTVNPYFITVDDAGDQAVLFQTPVDGIKTSANTKFARTELREDYAGTSTYPDTGNKSWSMIDGRTHRMTIVEKIDFLPLKHPEQALGQIHDPNNDTFMLKAVGNNEGTGLRSTAYKLIAQFDNSSVKAPLVLGDGSNLLVPFGSYFTLDVLVNATGICTATVTFSGQSVSASHSSWASIDPTQNYYKAGNYIQSNVADYGEAAGDYSQVTIKSVTISHR